MTKYKIEANINGTQQTELKCNKSTLILWIDYFLRKGYTITITNNK